MSGNLVFGRDQAVGRRRLDARDDGLGARALSDAARRTRPAHSCASGRTPRPQGAPCGWRRCGRPSAAGRGSARRSGGRPDRATPADRAAALGGGASAGFGRRCSALRCSGAACVAAGSAACASVSPPEPLRSVARRCRGSVPVAAVECRRSPGHGTSLGRGRRSGGVAGVRHRDGAIRCAAGSLGVGWAWTAGSANATASGRASAAPLSRRS